MGILEDKNKLERLDRLIRLEKTGRPDELASKFNTSKRTIYRTINVLKEIGCPVFFCKNRISYCYKTNGKLIIKFEPIENSSLLKIKGGCISTFFMSDTPCH